jgi:hypothetical protein
VKTLIVKYRYQWLIAIIFLFTIPLLNPIIRGDGVGYYAYVRSLFIDGDLHFKNEYMAGNIDFVEGVESQDAEHFLTKTGHYVNQWSVGPSIMWSPFFLIAHLSTKFLNLTGSNIASDGYSLLYRYAMAIGTLIYGFMGLLLIFHILNRYFSGITAFLTVLTLLFASSLPVYFYFQPSMSHAHSLFSVSLFFLMFQRARGGFTLKQSLLLGLSGGLMIIVYYVNAIFLIFPLIFYLSKLGSEELDKLIKKSAMFLSGLVGALLPHFIVKMIIYGSFLRTGYEWQEWYFLKPKVLSVLFSPLHGFLSWTPVFVFSLIGLFLFYRRDKMLALLASITFVIFTYIISSFSTWHGISSFGNRFFISCYPILSIGLAEFISRIKNTRLRSILYPVLVFLCFWNLGFIFQWGTGLVSKRAPVNWSTVFYNQIFVVPLKATSMTWRYFSDREGFRKELIELDRSYDRVEERKSW